MSSHPFRIAPSILSANFSDLRTEIVSVLNAGANLIHFDVMDNHYVNNLTIGPLILKSLRSSEALKAVEFDIHLMTYSVDQLIQEFSKYQANTITFHCDATENILQSIHLTKSLNAKVGLALNPNDSIDIIQPYLPLIDQVLVMSVHPGFGGQSFIESTYQKIKDLKQYHLKNKLTHLSIMVDGGISSQNIQKVALSGADTFVAGSAIFNSNNYANTIGEMISELNNIPKQ